MRKRPIKTPESCKRHIDVLPAARQDGMDLADILNASAKPAGFPQTVKLPGRPSKPMKISPGLAHALAIALIRDMLDDGRIRSVDLLMMVERGE